MPIDRPHLFALLPRLVQINSVNPSLAPGAPGEREIAGFVAAELRGLGLEVRTFEPQPGRVTVVGRLPGTGGAPSLMLYAHSDTVDPGAMPDPFSGAIREGRFYGRGAFDMKCGLAASIACVKALRETGPLRGDVLVAAVADEEYGSLGMTDLLTHLKPDAAIVTEPTGLNVCLAHKGYLWIEVRIEGRAAHGSKFELGIDANMKMGAFLAALSALERDLRTRPPHPLIGPPSLHAALLSGGTGLSTYAASAHVQIERRTVPGETEAQAVAEIQEIVSRLSAEDPDFHATVRPFFTREPFEVAPEAGIVRILDRAIEQVRGRKPVHVGDTPWMDAALLSAAGVETVICGATGAGAHADEEWVDLESVVALSEILEEAARACCS